MKSTACEAWAQALEAQTKSDPAPALPQGGAVSGRPDLLVLVRRILGKRDPAALAVLDAGLVVATRGEQELAAWLERPLETGGEEQDPAKALERALAAATLHAEQLPPLHPRAATILGVVGTLGTKLENVTKGRPKLDTPDEATARLVAVRAKVLPRLLPRLEEAEGQIAAWRAGVETWGATELRPADAAELRRHLAAMPGAPAP